MTTHSKKPLRKSAATPRSVSSSTTTVRARKLSTTKRVYRTEEDPTFAPSFLQFCAHCETQITTPTASLYCSSSCRRADTTPTDSTSTLYSPSPVRLPSAPSYLPFLSPTFRPPTPPLPPTPTTTPFEDSASFTNRNTPPRRPTHHTRTHTGGSTNIISGTEAVPMVYGARPLPPRHRPMSFSGSPRSVELVTPFGAAYAQSPPQTPPEERWGGGSRGLFNFEAMARRPESVGWQ